MSSDPVQAILARAHPPAELLRRVEPLLGAEDGQRLAALLPELLHALGVVADADADDPLAPRLLGLVRRLSPAAPEAARGALREALAVGWLFPVRGPLVELLAGLGEDLPMLREVAAQLARHAEGHERRRGLALLCALDEPAEELLTAEVERPGRLEGQRAVILAEGMALPRLAEALADQRPGVRCRAEAALGLLGEAAAPAARALLRMPPWPDEDGERPSPVLRALPAEAVRAAMEGEEGSARRRAERVLGEAPAQRTPLEALAALADPATREAAFVEAFAAWFADEDGQRERYVEATLDRLERFAWLPTGPLRVEASRRGLRRGLRAAAKLCRRTPSLRPTAQALLERLSSAVAVRPEAVPWLRRIFRT